ncbi:hypothetical protein [uncultured Kocuria sp.]|uniref:hypothetical protein n=1 Tax=uncultured Kocuria sp. TaxID=259305 RepID=UPI00262EE0D4|nr:hypothetical protein [uncultured Kocuria sp.]
MGQRSHQAGGCHRDATCPPGTGGQEQDAGQRGEQGCDSHVVCTFDAQELFLVGAPAHQWNRMHQAEVQGCRRRETDQSRKDSEQNAVHGDLVGRLGAVRIMGSLSSVGP